MIRSNSRNWPEVYANYIESGWTITKFCSVNGISISAFYRNREKYFPLNDDENPFKNSAEESESIGFFPVSVPEEAQQINSVPIKINGVKLDLPEDIPQKLMTSIIKGCLEA